MAKLTALALAKAFAAEITKLHTRVEGHAPGALSAPVVRNKKQTAEHGWMPGALASVTYEGGSADMVAMTLTGDWHKDGYYIEPYSSWLVGVFKAS